MFEKEQWMHKSHLERFNNTIKVCAPKNTDCFVNPVAGVTTVTAPFLYEDVKGDFILRAKVKHEFIAVYDACVLFAYEHEKLWAKACFEYTDLNTHAVVSVMTNEYSDDANGAVIEGNEVYLQLSRKDNVFAIHYSLNGTDYYMARLTYLPMNEVIKVGIVAQSPIGEGAYMEFSDIHLIKETIDDIRDGNQVK